MISKSILKYPPIKSSIKKIADNNFVLTVEPLLHGYGYTLGNSLRRLLLSSVPGFAITEIRINDLTHEYQPIDGVVEDAIDVIINLKKLNFKILTDDDSVTINLNKSSAGEVRGKDFKTEKKAEIVNPEEYICHLSKDIDLDIEIKVARGVGYLPNEKINFAGNIDPHIILVDALFSPVTRVELNVEQVRVGDKTDYDKLELNFTTNKTVEAKEVVEFSISILNDLFLQIGSALKFTNVLTQDQVDQELARELKEADLKLKEAETKKEEVKEKVIDLDENIVAILEKNGITSNEGLKKIKLKQLDDFAGLGKTEITEIKKYIKKIKA